MSRILIVEDEKHLAEGLRFNLEADGFDVSVTDKADPSQRGEEIPGEVPLLFAGSGLRAGGAGAAQGRGAVVGRRRFPRREGACEWHHGLHQTQAGRRI